MIATGTMAASPMWSDLKAESVRNLCDVLIDAGSLMGQKAIEIDAKLPPYKKAAIATLKLKHFNREIQQALELKRIEVETEKKVVETLKLQLENVIYKKAYLQREIRVLKDYTTPELNAVEREIGRPLAAIDSSTDDLSAIEAAAKDVMNGEIIDREETSKRLEQLVLIMASKEEVLDKKRKFLDDIPLRLNLVKASTADIQAQFDAYKNGLNSSEEITKTPEGEEEDDGIEMEEEEEITKEDGEEDFESMEVTELIEDSTANTPMLKESEFA